MKGRPITLHWLHHIAQLIKQQLWPWINSCLKSRTGAKTSNLFGQLFWWACPFMPSSWRRRSSLSPVFRSPWTRSRKYLLWRFLPVEYHWAKSKKVNSLNPDKYSFNHLNISYLEKRKVKRKSSVSFEKSKRWVFCCWHTEIRRNCSNVTHFKTGRRLDSIIKQSLVLLISKLKED